MFVKVLFLSSSPFFQAYIQSDFLGKLIFLSLIFCSIWCWSLLIYKIFITKKSRTHSIEFCYYVEKQKGNPLQIENDIVYRRRNPNPFFDLYLVLKKQTIGLLTKNQQFEVIEGGGSYLSSSDVDYIESHLMMTISLQKKRLEKNLFILSTIVGLAPLLGLLGTVWGILITFASLQGQSGTNQMVLGGISLALTTTVMGLLSAIPAMIAYNYLKNSVREFETEMESFANQLLSRVEMQYRKVDLNR
ncbi:MAG TPA: MotA/TolQ/ExbB proton channel family protein [Waddliaceae bacterium]